MSTGSSEAAMVSLQKLDPSFLDRVYEMEVAGFPPDEAASREKLQLRLEAASDYVRACDRARRHSRLCVRLRLLCTASAPNHAVTEVKTKALRSFPLANL